ncbi:MAG TPA: enoyl-CoA hydratase-related protein [Rhodothermales bacterium]|nr:enoyl-CoA hydratase-related protein [Rhodothermales bacterium]
MELKTIRFEVDGDGIALITIDQQDKLNALSGPVLSDLDAAFRDARSNAEVRGIVLTGAGEKSFVAGADIRQFTQFNALRGHRFALKGQVLFQRIEEMPKPVVAAINGFALGGGCELALACHLRVAAENASFGQPEVNLGLIPGFGGTQRLPRIVGRGIATEMILTGERVSAQRAYEIGLVNRLVPGDQLIDTAKGIALSIASKAPVAVSLALDAIRSSDLPLRDGLKYEAALFGQLCDTQDFQTGVHAFLERRKPEFTGS